MTPQRHLCLFFRVVSDIQNRFSMCLLKIQETKNWEKNLIALSSCKSRNLMYMMNNKEKLNKTVDNHKIEGIRQSGQQRSQWSGKRRRRMKGLRWSILGYFSQIEMTLKLLIHSFSTPPPPFSYPVSWEEHAEELCKTPGE